MRALGSEGAQGRREKRAAAEIVARSFRDNPLNVAVIRGSPARRLRSNRSGARVGLAAPMGEPPPLRLGAWSRPEVGVLEDAPRLAGVLLALAPFGYPAPVAPAWPQLRSLWGQGWRTARSWGEVYRALLAVHPTDPHWYLDVLAVDPDFQRRGVGRALLARFLASVDADARPSYLETDREENLAFYRAAGYEVVRCERVVGTDVWCLWREARASADRTTTASRATT